MGIDFYFNVSLRAIGLRKRRSSVSPAVSIAHSPLLTKKERRACDRKSYKELVVGFQSSAILKSNPQVVEHI